MTAKRILVGAIVALGIGGAAAAVVFVLGSKGTSSHSVRPQPPSRRLNLYVSKRPEPVSIPPQPTLDGRPALLAGSHAASRYLRQLDSGLNLPRTPARHVALIGTLVRSTSNTVTIRQERPTLAPPNADVFYHRPTAKPLQATTITAALTSGTCIHVAAAHSCAGALASLQPGTPLVVALVVEGGQPTASWVADFSDLRPQYPPPRERGPLAMSSTPRTLPATSFAVRRNVSVPPESAASVAPRALSSASRFVDSSEKTFLASTDASGNVLVPKDGTVFRGQTGWPGVKGSVSFNLGDENGCPYFKSGVELMLAAGGEWRWPFEFVGQSAQVSALSGELPEHAFGTSDLDPGAGRTFYFGLGAAANFSLEVGCKFFGVGLSQNFQTGFNEVLQNDTTGHAPLQGEDTDVPSTSCFEWPVQLPGPLASVPGVGDWLEFSVLGCADMTLKGAPLSASVAGAPGTTPQTVSLVKDGTQTVRSDLASGGKVVLSGLKYTPTLEVTPVLGVLFGAKVKDLLRQHGSGASREEAKTISDYLKTEVSVKAPLSFATNRFPLVPLADPASVGLSLGRALTPQSTLPSDNPSPLATTYEGQESGSLGSGTMTWSNVKRQGATFSADVAVNEANGTGEGTVSGRLVGHTLTFTLDLPASRNAANCDVRVTGSASATPKEIDGTFTGKNSCLGAVSGGQFSLTAGKSPASTPASRQTVRVTTIDGYRFQVSANPPQAVTQVQCPLQPADAPPGKKYVTVLLHVANPTDRPEPIYNADCSNGNVAPSLAFPVGSARAFGFTAGDVCGLAPAKNLCGLPEVVVASVRPESYGTIQNQVPAGGSVDMLVFNYAPIPASAPIDQVVPSWEEGYDRWTVIPIAR